MIILENQVLDISQLESFALDFCKNLKAGDILMLKGDLGVGKTTFSRFLINNLHSLKNIQKPNSIKSPSFPILITYDLHTYDIYHYDLYRIKNIKELEELDFFENIKNNITLIEWPDLLVSLPFKQKFYLVSLDFYTDKKE